MRKIHQRSASVDGFYRQAKPVNAAAPPPRPGLPVPGHVFRDLVPQLADRCHIAAPSQFGHAFRKLAQGLGRCAKGFGRSRFAAGDFAVGNRPALRGFMQAGPSVSPSEIFRENTRHDDRQECQAATLRLFDSKTIGIFTWGPDDRISGCNQAFLRIIGHDTETLVSNGLRWPKLTPPEWRTADEESLTNLQRIGLALPYEKEFFRKDGTRVPVLVTNTNPFRDAGQRLAFVVDLSDRKRAEDAARDSERRCQEATMELARVNRVAITGQLSASIVHEVSQPIAGAVTNAQVALRQLSAEPLDVHDVRQALNRMVRDGNRAADVIHRIRALISKTAPRRENLEINQAILEVVALTRGEVARHGVSLRTELAENLPPVQGDRVQLQQVMLNLIVNAVEAMSTSCCEPRDLRISTARAGSEVLLIAVQDTGPGVDAADLVRVFDAFYTTKSQGLGMGLSICRAIVAGHEGNLWVSPGTPRGAVFQFTLPVCKDDAS